MTEYCSRISGELGAAPCRGCLDSKEADRQRSDWMCSVLDWAAVATAAAAVAIYVSNESPEGRRIDLMRVPPDLWLSD